MARSPSSWPTRSPFSNLTCCKSVRMAAKPPMTLPLSSTATHLHLEACPRLHPALGDELLAGPGTEARNSHTRSESNLADDLPEDDDVPREVLDFFIPEAEEHLQIATQCLLGLESNATADEIHRLFRSAHTF